MADKRLADKRRILIVEDDLDTIHLLEQIVMGAGYEPILARGGEEGLRLLQEEGADLVLLDLVMRGVDGWMLLETVKAESRFSPIPVIIISARHPREDPTRISIHADMFEDYFTKPFEVTELVARLQELLQ
jgi:DNA-binding response OmpR family regulator